MSAHPLRCSTCGRDGVFDRCAAFGEGQEGVYAVAWRCPDGHGLSLDVCPVGPPVPAGGLCLNCGGRYPAEAADPACGDCGLVRSECLAALGLPDAPDDDPLAASRDAFARGLFRRGLAILNRALAGGLEGPDAWFLKARFLNSVGFNRMAAEMVGAVLGRMKTAADRIGLWEEQSYLWAECERGEDALRCADAAVGLGSRSVRTHYLRGRALALLGRLTEARDEMTRVLSLAPDNADARRALTMIDAASRPKEGKRWWQFWKP